MPPAQRLSEAATLMARAIGSYRAAKKHAGCAGDLTARERREYGLRCCPPGSIQDRRVHELFFWSF